MIEITIPGEPEQRTYTIQANETEPSPWDGLEVVYMVRAQDQDDMLAAMQTAGVRDMAEVEAMDSAGPLAFRLALAGARRVVTAIVSVRQDGEDSPIRLSGKAVKADNPDHKDALLMAIPGLAFHAQAEAASLSIKLVEERENLKAVPG